MVKLRSLPVLIALGALLANLGGCAAYEAHRKCGSGCPGDSQINAAVSVRLAQHPALQPPSQVYTRTLDGVVYLTGQVATPLQRATAESVARGAPGVVRVVNNIAISYGGR
jgi:osmotically-inducible protein OsmY